VTLVENGKRHALTFRIVRGLSYTYRLVAHGTVSQATLKAKVRVTRSTETSCHAGSTGTITMRSAPPAVTLKLCGALFTHPGHKASVRIEEN
jgi:hypothetical protein